MGSERQFSIRGHAMQAPPLPAGLYLVSTPIGNLRDITIRALEVLAACDLVACEDTRTSEVLLRHYAISRPRISYNEHNADRRGDEILATMAEGKSVALISDAGTPLVSDPGQRLVNAVHQAGLPVVPVPGASAPLAALVGSGLGGTGFQFSGFLPNKAAARKTALEKLASHPLPVMAFESPSRLVSTLTAICDVMGDDRTLVVARELTKMHETFHRGTARQLLEEFSALERVRGEIVIVIAPMVAEELDDEAVADLLKEALSRLKTKQAAAEVATQTGRSKGTLYKMALSLQTAEKDREG